MKSSFFGPAFALIARFGLHANFGLSIGLFVLAQCIAIGMLGAAQASGTAGAGFVSAIAYTLLDHGIVAAFQLAAVLVAIYLS